MARTLLALGLAALWLPFARGDGVNTFLWKFTTLFDTKVTTCKSYTLDIVPLATNSSSLGQPPYYMIEWPELGTPTIQALGSERSGLSYTVKQPADKKLLLTVVDSLGDSGGESSVVYDIQSGDTGCLPPAPSVNITLAANVSTSDDLETCDPLGLRVFGGQGPYNLSFAARSSPVVTNVSMGDGNDVFTWPNRADPNGMLIVSVVDSTGQWGTSTGFFKTAGSNETGYCPLNPQGGLSSEVDQHPAQPSKSNTGTIVAAVVVPVVVLSALAVLGWWLWRRKQRQKQAPEPAFMPDAWTGPNMAEYQGGGPASASAGDRGSYNPYDPPPSSKLARFRDDYGGSQSGYSRSDHGGGAAMFMGPGLSNRQSSFDDGSHSDGKTRSSTLPPGASQPHGQGRPDVIYHSDAGAIQEVPPPYIDRAGQSSSSNAIAPPNLLSNATSIQTSPEPESSDTKHGFFASNSERSRSPEPSMDYTALPQASPPLSPPLSSSPPPQGQPERPMSAGSTQGFRSLPEPPRIPTNKKGKGKEVLLS